MCVRDFQHCYELSWTNAQAWILFLHCIAHCVTNAILCIVLSLFDLYHSSCCFMCSFAALMIRYTRIYVLFTLEHFFLCLSFFFSRWDLVLGCRAGINCLQTSFKTKNHNKPRERETQISSYLLFSCATPENILKKMKTRQISDDAWPLLDIVSIHYLYRLCIVADYLAYFAFVIVYHTQTQKHIYVMIALPHLTFFRISSPISLSDLLSFLLFFECTNLLRLTARFSWLFQFNTNQ